MLCQLCKKNPATIKIAHILNQKKIEINLCSSCAEEKGVESPLVALPQVFSNYLAALFGNEIFSRKHQENDIRCEGCGTTWDKFQETGLLGCDICYLTFEKDLNVILRRIHGSTQHIGSRPKSLRHNIDKKELEKINIELKEAINNENFELAAELRDVIKDAQRNLDNN